MKYATIFKLILFLLVHSTTVVAQKESDEESKTRRHYIYTEPLTVLSASGVNLGTELGISNRLAITNGFSYGFIWYFLKEKVEIKLYFREDDLKNYRNYVSGGFTYKESQRNYGDSIYTDTSNYYTKYEVHRIIRAYTARYGQIYSFDQKLFFEWYVGIGVRYRNISCLGLTNEEIQNRIIGSPERAAFYHCGKSTVPDVVLGFKLGFNIAELFSN